jgi:hypothetical protein
MYARMHVRRPRFGGTAHSTLPLVIFRKYCYSTVRSGYTWTECHVQPRSNYCAVLSHGHIMIPGLVSTSHRSRWSSDPGVKSALAILPNITPARKAIRAYQSPLSPRRSILTTSQTRIRVGEARPKAHTEQPAAGEERRDDAPSPNSQRPFS